MKPTVSLIFGLGLLLLSINAGAFCRETGCNANTEVCERDPTTNCSVTGKPLAWPSACVDIYMQADAAPSQGIDFETAKQSLQRAVDTWLQVDCGGAAPSIQVNVRGPITCDTAEYNSEGHNANIVMFRDADWPHSNASDSIGYTDVSFGNNDTGQIWDADIELNAFEYKFSVGDPATDNDLDSALTHEVGHWLGLDHSQDPSATMYAHYSPGTTDFRSLAADDALGLCAIYPPSRTVTTTSCEPRNGFSDVCLQAQPPLTDPTPDTVTHGCAFSLQPVTPVGPCATLAVYWLGLRARRRRRRLTGCL